MVKDVKGTDEANPHTGGNGTDPQDVANKLHSAAIHLLRSLKGRDKTMGISGARLSALSVLYFAGPMTMSQLAKAEDVKLPTMSRLVKDMVLEQLVTRSASEADGRAQVIDMTPRGRSLFMRARVNRLMALTATMENLSEKNQEILLKAAELMEKASKAIRER